MSVDSALVDLAAAVQETRALLEQYGEQYVSTRMRNIETRLGSGDTSAVQSVLSEATGGMGSLADRILSKANGDPIDPKSEHAVNAKLSELVDVVADRARHAGRKLGLTLVR